jgi:hypothetical protein
MATLRSFHFCRVATARSVGDAVPFCVAVSTMEFGPALDHFANSHVSDHFGHAAGKAA